MVESCAVKRVHIHTSALLCLVIWLNTGISRSSTLNFGQCKPGTWASRGRPYSTLKPTTQLSHRSLPRWALASQSGRAYCSGRSPVGQSAPRAVWLASADHRTQCSSMFSEQAPLLVLLQTLLNLFHLFPLSLPHSFYSEFSLLSAAWFLLEL